MKKIQTITTSKKSVQMVLILAVSILLIVPVPAYSDYAYDDVTIEIVNSEEVEDSLLALCTTNTKKIRVTFRIVEKSGEFEEVQRNYNILVPASYNGTEPTPLILDYHGRYCGPLVQQLLSGFNMIANQNGVIVVYPQGTGSVYSFNGEVCCDSALTEGVNDIAFAEAIIEDVIRSGYNIDRTRVYVTGYSMGGGMVHLLARARPDLFAAAAPVGFSKIEGEHQKNSLKGKVWGIPEDHIFQNQEPTDQNDENPFQAASIPVIIFHGKQEDAVSPNPNFIKCVIELAQDWAVLNGWTGGAGSSAYEQTISPLNLLDGDPETNYYQHYTYHGDANVELWLLNAKHAPDIGIMLENVLHPVEAGSELFGGTVYWNRDLVSVSQKAWEFMSQYTTADHVTPPPVTIVQFKDDLEKVNGVTEINGNLIIKGTLFGLDLIDLKLTDLNGFESLSTITGSLFIRNNNDLSSLEDTDSNTGLVNLCHVGDDFTIQDNPGITPEAANNLKRQVQGCGEIGGTIDVDWECISYSATPIYHRNIGRAHQINNAIYLNGSNQFIGYWYSTYFIAVHKYWDDQATWYKGTCGN